MVCTMSVVLSSLTSEDTVPGVSEMVLAKRLMPRSVLSSSGTTTKAGLSRAGPLRMSHATWKLPRTMS